MYHIINKTVNMRNTYQLVILILVSISLNLNAQVTITLDSNNGTNVAGTQVIVNHLPTNNFELPYLYFTNISSSTQDWLITRKNITQPLDWFNYLCWGHLCYGISTLDVWSTELSELTNMETKKLSLYVGAPTIGSAHYRYYVSSGNGNFIDSVDIIVNITSTVGVKNLSKKKTKVFPNPAKNRVAITGLTTNQYNLSVYDLSGRQVLFTSNINQDDIDLTNLNNGQYILMFKNTSSQDYIKHILVIEK